AVRELVVEPGYTRLHCLAHAFLQRRAFGDFSSTAQVNLRVRKYSGDVAVQRRLGGVATRDHRAPSLPRLLSLCARFGVEDLNRGDKVGDLCLDSLRVEL